MRLITWVQLKLSFAQYTHDIALSKVDAARERGLNCAIDFETVRFGSREEVPSSKK